MTYQTYVIAAYMVFVVVLLWDFVAPRIRINQLLRAARLRIARGASSHSNAMPDIPHQ